MGEECAPTSEDPSIPEETTLPPETEASQSTATEMTQVTETEPQETEPTCTKEGYTLVLLLPATAI